MSQTTPPKFNSFAEFYPFYLAEHDNLICRRLHFVGSALIILLVAWVVFSEQWVFLWLLPVLGYGFAWTGHFFFEKNTPATFKHPFYSLLGDWVMFKDMLLGNIKR